MSHMYRAIRNHMRKLIVFGLADEGGVPAGTIGTPIGMTLLILHPGS